MSATQAEFNAAKKAYEDALAAASEIRMTVWSIYRMDFSCGERYMFYYVSSHPSAEEAKKHVTKFSSFDHVIAKETMSATEKRYDAEGFAADDVIDRFDSRLTGDVEVYPAQAHIITGEGDRLPGRAVWIPCRFVIASKPRANASARANIPRPADWTDTPSNPRYIDFTWPN